MSLHDKANLNSRDNLVVNNSFSRSGLLFNFILCISKLQLRLPSSIVRLGLDLAFSGTVDNERRRQESLYLVILVTTHNLFVEEWFKQNNDQTWFQQYPQQAPPPQQIKHDAAYNPDAAIDDGGGGWLDSAPGVAMEYKVHVDAAKEDCYWQYVHKGATFYMSSQVLKGIVMYQQLF